MKDDLQKEIEGELKEIEKKRPDVFKKSALEEELAKAMNPPKAPAAAVSTPSTRSASSLENAPKIPASPAPSQAPPVPVPSSVQAVKKSMADLARGLEMKARVDAATGNPAAANSEAKSGATNPIPGPKSIADLLKLEKKVAENPPRAASPLPQTSVSSTPKFSPSSAPLAKAVGQAASAINKKPVNPDAEVSKTFNVDSPLNNTKPAVQTGFPPLQRQTENVPPSQVSERLKQSVKTIDYKAKVPEGEITSAKRLRTLRGDIEEAMRSGKATVVGMAAAEADRRAEVARKKETPTPPKPSFQPTVLAPKSLSMTAGTAMGGIEATVPTIPSTEASLKIRSAGGKTRGTKMLVFFVSLLLIIGGAATFYFLNYTQKTPVVVITNENFQKPIIPAQFDVKINIDGHNESYVRASFDAENKRNKGSLNEIGDVLFTSGTKDAERSLTVDEFFSKAGMNPPEELLRTLIPRYMIGIHRFPENQTFAIFETDAYETAADAMKNWEGSLENELGKFLRSPNDFAYPKGVSENLSPRQFVDKVYKNIDTRALINENGDVLFFYAFLNRRYLVVTTSPETLAEIISGLAARTVTQ